MSEDEKFSTKEEMEKITKKIGEDLEQLFNNKEEEISK
jgi:ribosome recycling factor